MAYEHARTGKRIVAVWSTVTFAFALKNLIDGRLVIGTIVGQDFDLMLIHGPPERSGSRASVASICSIARFR